VDVRNLLAGREAIGQSQAHGVTPNRRSTECRCDALSDRKHARASRLGQGGQRRVVGSGQDQGVPRIARLDIEERQDEFVPPHQAGRQLARGNLAKGAAGHTSASHAPPWWRWSV
jgi:hypothetical protein